MASMWRRAMHYLGLGPDDEYEDGPALPYGGEAPAAPERPEPPQPVGRARTAYPPPPESRPAPDPTGGHDAPAVRPLGGSRRPAPRGVEAGVERERREGSASVRTLAGPPRVERIAPGGFNDAQKVADRFKAGQAVAMDLGDVDRELARRLIDFCSGLCYASNGNMERVGAQVYLISPGGVEVPAEERRRLGGEAAPASGR